jgi:hypothetical protein
LLHVQLYSRGALRGPWARAGRSLVTLDDAREQGLSVLPFCPFINRFIHEHREYADLVPGQNREAFGL